MSDQQYDTTLLRRQIGRQFADLRQRAKMTVVQAAKRLETSQSTINRVEHGDERVHFKTPIVQYWCLQYGATPEETEMLLRMTADTRGDKGSGWWQSYLDKLTNRDFSLFVRLEGAAAAIVNFEVGYVPGLLQTRSYAEGLFRTMASDGAEIEAAIEIRMRRQSLLGRADPPQLDFVLDEAAVRRPVGSAATMLEQLAHVLEVGARDNVTVRILPYSAGAHRLMGKAFALMTFPTDDKGKPVEPPLVHVDTFTGSMMLNRDDEIDAYRQAWLDISSKSLDVDASRALVTQVMGELGG